jgi:mono/diheme cytochrome c family protein
MDDRGVSVCRGGTMRRGGAGSSPPPPCGEGSGVGVGRSRRFGAPLRDPPPHPTPARGKGVPEAQLQFQFTSIMGRLAPALCAAALVIAATPAFAQGALPPGEGRDLLATACSQCHQLNVIRSMREGADGWRRHVYNMVTRGAQLNAREAEMVVAYLAANFGPTTPAASPTPVALPGGPGKELVEARCTACHDLERVASAKRHKTEWPALVANMVGRGAVATPEEAQAISSYLATYFGGE